MTALVLVAIPFALLLIVGELARSDRQAVAREAFERRAGDLVERMGARTDAESYVRKLLWPALEALPGIPRRCGPGSSGGASARRRGSPSIHSSLTVKVVCKAPDPRPLPTSISSANSRRASVPGVTWNGSN